MTKDSTEGELVALSDMLTKIERTQEFLQEQGVDLEDPPLILEDNTSMITIVVSMNNKQARTRHLQARKGIIHKAWKKRKSVEIEYVSTKNMGSPEKPKKRTRQEVIATKVTNINS